VADEPADLATTIGGQVLVLVALCFQAGWTAPGEALPYLDPRQFPFLVDFVTWTARKPGWPEARDRLEAFVKASQLDQKLAADRAEAFGPLLEAFGLPRRAATDDR